MDFLNAIILLLNYIFVPALTYGSQLALGAIFVTLIYGILRFANFATGDMMSFGTMFTILFTWYFQSVGIGLGVCLLYTSPSPRDVEESRMPSSA